MLLAVLGDSLTYGFPFGEKVSWLYVMAERLGIRALNYGVCGDTTADMVSRLNSVLVNEGLTHFIVFGGANDLFMGRTGEDVLNDTYRIAKRAQDKGLQTGCILPLVPAVEEYAWEFVNVREQIKKAAWPGVHLIDLSAALPKDDDRVNYIDGVHLSVAGNNALGAYAALSLKTWLLGGEC